MPRPSTRRWCHEPARTHPPRPVGTGPFACEQFVPGQRSRFRRHEDYWDTRAAIESLTIIDFSDDAAKVNALLTGQVHTIGNLPPYLAGMIGTQGARTLISETGGWAPFTMRADVAPLSDVRVRQAMRLIVDRHQMIDQALSGGQVQRVALAMVFLLRSKMLVLDEPKMLKGDTRCLLPQFTGLALPA